MATVYVNRDKELEAFEHNIAALDWSLILVEGESGTGKTALLVQFEKILKRKATSHCFVNFRNSTHTPIDIVDACLRMIGRVHCAGLQEAFNAFGQVSGIVIKDNKLTLGAKITIDAQLNLRSEQERDFWYSQISTAFFDDLTKAPERCYVLLMDTFEQASDMVQAWVDTHLLSSIRSQRKLMVVISGQQVPVLDVEWTDHCKRFVLSGLELPYWETYAQGLRVQLPHPEWLKAWYFLFKGKPAAMVGAFAALSDRGTNCQWKTHWSFCL